MRITLKTQGGIAFFPGLSRPISLNTEILPDDDRLTIKSLVDQVRFFELPKELSRPARGSADMIQYSLTVRSGRQQHTVRFADPIEVQGLQQLVEYVQTKGELHKAP
jgi:hypothetical protein